MLYLYIVFQLVTTRKPEEPKIKESATKLDFPSDNVEVDEKKKDTDNLPGQMVYGNEDTEIKDPDKCEPVAETQG